MFHRAPVTYSITTQWCRVPQPLFKGVVKSFAPPLGNRPAVTKCAGSLLCVPIPAGGKIGKILFPPKSTPTRLIAKPGRGFFSVL